MKKFVLPMSVLSLALMMAACEDASQLQDAANQVAETAKTVNAQVQATNAQVQQGTDALASGSMLSILRDVADLQLKTSDHLARLEATKTMLEQAVSNQDLTSLSIAVEQLDTQLHEFNGALEVLNLKSQEIDDIRQKILATNAQVLASPLLTGELDLKTIDLLALEKQMGNIEGEMLKLAAMLLENQSEA